MDRCSYINVRGVLSACLMQSADFVASELCWCIGKAGKHCEFQRPVLILILSSLQIMHRSVLDYQRMVVCLLVACQIVIFF
mmetsp:Transcript_23498/g.59360  ORF Transcript_23498/g.59360 Transcript_23498/m.59360 type:complete len:81 (-) Transcript_23498:58-300(-)